MEKGGFHMELRLMDNQLGFELMNEATKVGHILWQLDGTTMVMTSTFIDDSLRGQNKGIELLDAAANFAREHGYKMKPVCPYIVKIFDRMDKYDDVKI